MIEAPVKAPKKTRVDPKEYRKPMLVTEWRAVGKEVGYSIRPALYPVCPRCDSTFEREYQQFCDRCGQRLGWRKPRAKKKNPG